MRIEYHPAAADELHQIRDFYESRSVGLGVEFVAELEQQMLRIAAMPERWMIVRKNIRRSLMKRFPYVIFFQVIDGDCIRVTVLKHEKRHPGHGMQR